MKAVNVKLLKDRACTKGQAQTLQGQLLHLATTRPGRAGRGPLRELTMASASLKAGNIRTDALSWGLHFALYMLEQPHERAYSIVRSTAPKARLWSDASFHEVHGVPEMKL